jgi:hypothetical protein
MAQAVVAATIRVPLDHPTIQGGLDAASGGDTVLVAPGVFVGGGNRDLDFRGKGLTLLSEAGPEATTIDCENNGRGFLFATGETEEAVLEGFSIRNGTTFGPTFGGALVCEAASPRVINCIFKDNHAPGGNGGAVFCAESSVAFVHCAFYGNRAFNLGGALFLLTSTPVIDDCTFVDNSGIWGGAIVLGSSVATMSRCVFKENGAIRGAGIYLSASSLSATECSFAGNQNGMYLINSSSVTLSKSIVAFSFEGPAIVCAIGSAASLDCCDVFGNEGGDWAECLLGQDKVRGNFSADPLFCDVDQGNLMLAGNSPCLDGNHPQGAPCGLIGTLPEGCPPVSVESVSWGAIKARWIPRRPSEP